MRISDSRNLSYFKKSVLDSTPKPTVSQYLSKEGFNRRDRLRVDYRDTRNDFQRHGHDTGSSEVQGRSPCSIQMIYKYCSSCSIDEEDQSSRTTYHKQSTGQICNKVNQQYCVLQEQYYRIMHKLISSRRKLLVYLRRTKFDLYCTVIERLKLKDTFIKQVNFPVVFHQLILTFRIDSRCIKPN